MNTLSFDEDILESSLEIGTEIIKMGYTTILYEIHRQLLVSDVVLQSRRRRRGRTTWLTMNLIQDGGESHFDDFLTNLQ
jgi:hypothetical protein